MIRTQLQQLIPGLVHPVVMGGMTGVGTPELAAAVSNAGALGLFAIHNAGSLDEARRWIRRAKTLTTRPFGVNLTILPSVTPIDYEGYAQVIIEEDVKIVETAGSNPKKWVTLFKSKGLFCIHKCVTIRHAVSAQKLGVDLISLDGFEAAGHVGEGDVGNLVLQAKAAKVLKTPYIMSGGVADGEREFFMFKFLCSKDHEGKQLVAALALGAIGVNLGTRFCATKECLWPSSFKQAMIDATEEDSVLLFRNLHNTARVFKNKTAAEAAAIEKEKGVQIQFGDIAHLVAGTRGRAAEANNDKDGGIWSAGSAVGLIDDIPTCQQLLDRFIEEAYQTIHSRLVPMAIAKSKL